MTLMKWKPFTDIEKAFEDDFPTFSLLPEYGWDLACDVFEKEGNVVAEMSIPGINPDELEITVEDDYLKVSGSRDEEKETKDKNFYSKEIKRGSFERTIALPTSVQKDKAEALCDNGVLTVTIPTKNENNEKVKIKVKK